MPYESLIRKMDKKKRRRSKGDKRAKAKYSRYRRGGRKGTRSHKLKAESMDTRYRRTIMQDIGRELFSWQGGQQGLATALEQAQRKLGSTLSFSYVTTLGDGLYQVDFRDGSKIIFQENPLGAGRPYRFRVKKAENWGGDPKGPLAKALAKARKKSKESKKPLKITSLDAKEAEEDVTKEMILSGRGNYLPNRQEEFNIADDRLSRPKAFDRVYNAIDVIQSNNLKATIQAVGNELHEDGHMTNDEKEAFYYIMSMSSVAAETFEDNEYIYDEGRWTAGQRKLAHRIMKHLSQYNPEWVIKTWDMPMEISQPGLVKHLMVGRSYLNPVLLFLEENGFIVSTQKRVLGEKRKRKVYYLTSKGFNSLGRESWYEAEDLATEWETDWDALMCSPRDHDWRTQLLEIGQNHNHAFTRIKCTRCNLELYLQTLHDSNTGDGLERCGFCGAPNGLAPCTDAVDADWCELDPNPENPYNAISRNLSSETFNTPVTTCPNCRGNLRRPGCTHHGVQPLMTYRQFEAPMDIDGDGIIEPWEIESHEHHENGLNALGHSAVHLAEWHSRKLKPSEIKEQVINIFKTHPTAPYLTLPALANYLNEGVGKFHQTSISRISRTIGAPRGGIDPFYVTLDGKVYFIGDEDRATFIKGVS